MRLLDRVTERYRAGYYEGMASGAAVLISYGGDDKREGALQQIVAAAQQAYATNGVVFACELARIMLFAEARFQLQSLADKRLFGGNGTRGTPDLQLLEHPWPDATTSDLLAWMELDVGSAGNAFIWQAEPDLLVRMPPDEVTIVSEVVRGSRGRYRRVLGYTWDPTSTNPPGTPPGRGDEEQAQYLTVDEVAHHAPYPDPQAHFRGMSWLTPVQRDYEADSGMTAYKAQYLDHAATPNLVIQYPQKLRPDTVDRITERIAAKYGGVTNAFRTIVIDQGATATPVGSTFDQLDYSAVQGIGEDRICAAAGVDPILLGLLTIGRASVQYPDAMRRLAEMTCRHLWKCAAGALQKFVPGIPDRGVRLWFDLSDVPALRQSETERAQASQVLAAALVTFVQAGADFDSAVAALTSHDISQLKKAATPPPVAGAPSGGQPGVPRAPSGMTQTQTPASKLPRPATFANAPSVNGNVGGVRH